MNLWQQFSFPQRDPLTTQGVALHFEKGIDPEFRKLCITFLKWLRNNYCFPVHLNIYIKDCEKIRLLNGKMAYGGFRYFDTKTHFDTKPPYIRIPAKINPQEYEGDEDFEIHYSILGSLVHELTHYYQWVAGLEQSERQANYFRFRIIEQFCENCNLPF